VPDLEVGVSTWSALLDRTDWLVYTYTPENVPELGYRGDKGMFSLRLALSGEGPQLELIQPLDGPSIYHDWIAGHGYGVHHLGFHVPSCADVVAQLAEGGYQAVQTGSGYGLDGDGGFAYYDTVETLGLYMEVIEAPGRRRPSESI
jgi:hypothetical protein